MELFITKLTPEAILPEYAHDDDSGMDLFSIDETNIEPQEIKLIHTGIAIQLPIGTEAQIRPRSGLALKYGITILNSPGTIDAGYRGEIGIIMINHGRNIFNITKGMKIAQMVINTIIKPTVIIKDQLDTSDRGSGGFGSTGI